MGNSTEEDILTNHIDPYIKDDVDASTEVKAEATETPTEEGQQPTDGGNAGDLLGGDKETESKTPHTTKAGEGKDQQQQQNKGTAGPQDLRLPNGEIIKGGKERRFYENWQRSQQNFQSLERQHHELRAKVEAFEKVNTIGTQYNLSPDEVTTAGQLLAAWKADPVETAKYMLTQLRAMGHSIEGIGGGVDTAAIKQLVSEAVKPFIQDRELTNREAQLRADADRTYNSFINQYPDSITHDESIALLLTKDPNLSLETAYLMLKNYYLENGLDWNTPLSEYKKRNESGATGQTQQTQQRQQPVAQPRTSPGLPVGRQSQVNVTDQSPVSSADDDWNNIIRDSLRESGYNF
jgi:hypothetical protein